MKVKSRYLVKILAIILTTKTATGVAHALSGPHIQSPELSAAAGAFAALINTGFWVSGSVFVVMVFVSAAKYAMSQGDPKGLEGAKQALTYAVFGFLVALSFFTLTRFTVINVGSNESVLNDPGGNLRNSINELVSMFENYKSDESLPYEPYGFEMYREQLMRDMNLTEEEFFDKYQEDRDWAAENLGFTDTMTELEKFEEYLKQEQNLTDEEFEAKYADDKADFCTDLGFSTEEECEDWVSNGFGMGLYDTSFEVSPGTGTNTGTSTYSEGDKDLYFTNPKDTNTNTQTTEETTTTTNAWSSEDKKEGCTDLGFSTEAACDSWWNE